MKKMIAGVLALLMVAFLVACNDNKEGETTLNTTISPATTTAASQTATKDAQSVGMTYILTTQQGQTMPTVVTTLFNLANETTAAPAETVTAPDFSFTVPSMTAPNVVSEQLSTTATTTTTATTEKQTEPEGTTVPDSEKTRKYLELNSYAFNSSENIELEFSLDNWNGGVRSKSLSNEITVSYDGTSKKITGYVKQSGDVILITLYTKSLNIPEDTTVNFVIPAGAVVSKNGDQTSMEYSASAVKDLVENSYDDDTQAIDEASTDE